MSAVLRSWLALALGTVAALAVLWAQARSPLWKTHLSTDVGVFAQRAQSFQTSGSWAGLTHNEYQPGALFFFLLPALLSRFGHSYLDVFLVINGFLLVLHAVVLRVLGGPWAAWLVLLLFLAAGPISLFRFELLVSLLVLLAFVAWLKGRNLLGGMLLGLAAGVKVYPLLLLLLLARRAALRRLLAGSVIGLGLLFLAFWTMGGSAAAVGESLSYHLRKPAAVQSVWGGVATLVALGLGVPFQFVNTYGIHGVELPATVSRLAALGLVCALALALLAALRIGRLREEERTRVAVPLHVALLSLVVWPTGFQPQYLLWPLAFTALLPRAGVPRALSLAVVVLHALTLATTQVLYPVRFSAFLDMVYGRTPVFSLLLMLSLFLAALVLLYSAALRALRSVRLAHG